VTTKHERPEDRYYRERLRGRPVVLLLDTSPPISVRGIIQWRDDYSIGFIPDEDVVSMGMTGGREALIMKGFVRIISPDE